MCRGHPVQVSDVSSGPVNLTFRITVLSLRPAICQSIPQSKFIPPPTFSSLPESMNLLLPSNPHRPPQMAEQLPVQSNLCVGMGGGDSWSQSGLRHCWIKTQMWRVM